MVEFYSHRWMDFVGDEGNVGGIGMGVMISVGANHVV